MTEIAVVHSLRNATITSFFCALGGSLYALAQVDPSPPVALFFTAAPVIAVILWVQRDAFRTGVGSVHDLGLFLWLAWPVVIPWYAWKTRGRSGLRLTIVLFALILSAHLSWLVVSWLVYALEALGQ